MRLLATSIVALCATAVLASAHAAEGRVADTPAVTVDDSRQAQYSRSDTSTAAGADKRTNARSHSVRANKSTKARVQREKSVTMSSHASDFYFHDADSVLITDRDGDGYYSEFRVRFDADSHIGDVRVYARLYLRRLGESEWFLYRETDDFWIEGYDDDDDYYVTTTLEDGFATGEYDVLIDLYESGYSGIVATIGPYEMPGLAYLPLEEVGLDVPIELEGYSIGDVSTMLYIDDDGDGHYSRFGIAFDPDADFGGTYVYARVWVRPQGGTWLEEHVTEDFLVDAHGNADTYEFTADWISGYPTAYYDVQIDLFDSATNMLVASAGSERPELAQIPLEDESRDRRPNPPVSGGGGDSVSHERGGGGAFGWLALLGLGAIGVIRRKKQ